jgi:adenosylmethionine-8-amino-7-oxononanoate aminotransferase
MIFPLRPVEYVFNMADFVHGKGLYVYDDSGKQYIDAISGLWNVSFGYGNERINQAIVEQLDALQYVNLICSSTALNKNYSDRLISMLGNVFEKCLYVCSGSEAIESAIKVARKYHRILGHPEISKIVIFDISYHGTTYAAMSASGMDYEESLNYGPTVPGFIKVKAPFILQNDPNPEKRKKEILDDLEKVMKQGDQIAAFLMEPIIGSAGIITVPDWYQDAVKEYIEKDNILLILDEVATGFGRTGTLFYYMQMKLTPDIMCLSKGIDNGSIPMGVTLLGKRITRTYIAKHEHIEHFSTQMGNPMACAAAMEVLKLLEDGLLLEHIKEIGSYLKLELRQKLNGLGMIREVRGTGLMLGIDLIDVDGEPLDLESLFRIEAVMRKGGLLVYPFFMEGQEGGISLFPAYCITKKDADKIVCIIVSKLKRYARQNVIEKKKDCE